MYKSLDLNYILSDEKQFQQEQTHARFSPQCSRRTFIEPGCCRTPLIGFALHTRVSIRKPARHLRSSLPIRSHLHVLSASVRLHILPFLATAWVSICCLPSLLLSPCLIPRMLSRSLFLPPNHRTSSSGRKTPGN